ncbi:DUF4367 domain-containing protein [Pseudobacteroides cellulosolvens]|uniref:DUF4367 domain-containing protein n=1 Tax=Pseudobacteroides cellulosolvens ATCC 35603 = DSM 2933 TaxID=398512 RepID=A0A0L6JUK6_9FIRM|nr:DUF4367 domain-containing protein [Pseudobacteroides cellulosolvens]KNY29404.1 hypothetical protein Bccel_4678 [Pseudobacteroides cellulosolvens ATCC 35603 = DSM 2933]
MKNNIDNIIKDVLNDEVKEVSNAGNIFNKIAEDIEAVSVQSMKDHKQYTQLGFKKYFSLAACLILIFTTLTFISSAQARALAAEAIQSIKTIFGIQVVDNKLKIVEVPVDKAFTGAAVSRNTDKSDGEISKKIGYTVTFPKYLGGFFELENKSMGVQLKSPVDYGTAQKLQKDMFDALEDDNTLNKLMGYGAARNASGAYKKSDKEVLFINTSQTFTLSEFKKIYDGAQFQKVKVGSIDALWVKTLYPEYPLKSDSNIGQPDLSVKPKISERSFLLWEKSNIVYTLDTFRGYYMPMDEALKLAEEFMQSN